MSTSIDDAAEHFQPKLKQSDLLAQNKTAVLRLRCKGATYAQIGELLRENGIEVSEASIIRFCRRHSADIKRENTNQESDAITQIHSLPMPLSSSQSKPRDLRGPV